MLLLLCRTTNRYYIATHPVTVASGRAGNTKGCDYNLYFFFFPFYHQSAYMNVILFTTALRFSPRVTDTDTVSPKIRILFYSAPSLSPPYAARRCRIALTCIDTFPVKLFRVKGVPRTVHLRM